MERSLEIPIEAALKQAQHGENSSGFNVAKSSRNSPSTRSLTCRSNAPSAYKLTNLRMDVALTTDRREYSPSARPRARWDPNVLLNRRLRESKFAYAERQRREQGACPGAEVFGSDIAAGDLAQVGIDVGRGHVLALAILVGILEQLLARQVLAGLDDLGDAPVLDLEPPGLAAFALEDESQFRAVDGDVGVLQSRQPVALFCLA